MKSYDIAGADVKPHAPQIVSSTADSRVIVLELPAGERLQDHEVHERALLVVIRGEVEVVAGSDRTVGGPGWLYEFEPKERHEVVARSAARLLLLLSPWPGDGHPGAMTIEEKREARSRAAERVER